MEMAFLEQLQNHKLLKLWVLTLWFKDSGGTTKKRSSKDFSFFVLPSVLPTPTPPDCVFLLAARHSEQVHSALAPLRRSLRGGLKEKFGGLLFFVHCVL